MFRRRKVWPLWSALALALTTSPVGLASFTLTVNGAGVAVITVLLLTISVLALSVAIWSSGRIYRSLQVTSAGVEIQVGDHHYVQQWSEVTKVRTLKDPTGHIRLCVYPKLTTPLPWPWRWGTYHPFLDRRSGWIALSRLDAFGVPGPLIVDAVSRYSGPLWTDGNGP